MNNFIPVHLYAKKHKVRIQNVYRWIREGKFKDENIKKEKITVERLRIKSDVNVPSLLSD